MTKLDQILDQFPDTPILKCDGCDECVLGYEYNWDGLIRLIYSVDKILTNLVGDGMDVDDAIEYFEFNIRGAYVGEQTPIWCQDDF
jgi:hypothetical protein